MRDVVSIEPRAVVKVSFSELMVGRLRDPPCCVERWLQVTEAT